MNDESFLNVDLNDAVEPTVVADGEYALIIRNAEHKKSQTKQAPMLAVRLEIENEPTSKDINHFLMLPDPNTMSAKELNNAKWRLKEFCEAFNIPFSGGQINLAAMQGSRGWAVLTTQSDPQYGEQNRVKSFTRKA